MNWNYFIHLKITASLCVIHVDQEKSYTFKLLNTIINNITTTNQQIYFILETLPSADKLLFCAPDTVGLSCRVEDRQNHSQ